MKLIKMISVLLVLLMLLSSCSQTAQGNIKETAKETGVEDESGAETEDATEDTVTGGTLEEFKAPLILYYIDYGSAENGKIVGETAQLVKRGEAAYEVKAVADEGYIFAGWTDGVKTEVRKDENVLGDIFVDPIFVKEGTIFKVRYEVRMGGKIIEERDINGMAGNTTQYTAPKASLGYTYGLWSDGLESLERKDTAASDGETYVINMVPLSLGVPTIEINVNDGTGITDRLTYKDCTVTMSNTDEEDCFENINAQIRGRGNSSWSYDKKGFKLKFTAKRSMLGSEYKAKSWIFISNYGDKSLLRNMIGYDLSEELSGLKYTVMHEFIDVYLNGEYYGLFMLTDKIDVGDGRVDIAKEISEDPSQTSFILEIGAATKEDNTEGLFVKNVDYFTTGKDPNRGYYINYPDTKDPEYIPEVHLTYISDYVNSCLQALSDQDWEKICELIDVTSFIDYFLIQDLYANKDAFWRSVHFYKEPGGKLCAGPIWDLDQGLGNVCDGYGTKNAETTPYTDFAFVDSEYKKTAGKTWVECVSTWNRRLLRNEEYVELVKERLLILGPKIDKVLERAVTDGSNPNSYYALYGKAMERNFERWKIMGVDVWPNTKTIVNIKTVEGQIDYMRNWMIERYYVLCDYYGVS